MKRLPKTREGFSMSNKKIYSIGEVSEKTGVSIRTLHYYDEVGLLKPAKNESSGHREYDENDLITLYKIMSFKSLGFSLERIKELVYGAKSDLSLLDAFQMQKEIMLQQIKNLEKKLETLDQTIDLLKDKGEIDDSILMSLIHNLQTEDKQREWLEKYIDKDVLDQFYEKFESKRADMNKEFVEFSQKVKELYGKPVDSPEVMALVEESFNFTMEYIDEEVIEIFAGQVEGKDLEDIDLEELQNMVPSPFTKEEDEWLNQAIEYYVTKSGRFGFGENNEDDD